MEALLERSYYLLAQSCGRTVAHISKRRNVETASYELQGLHLFEILRPRFD